MAQSLARPLAIWYDDCLPIDREIVSIGPPFNPSWTDMAINAYSVCPGGTGKKIKFCCADLLDEFEQIERMVDGQQYLACLKHLERLEKTHPGRACLLATKTLLLRLTGQDEEAKSAAAAFLRLYPDNPVALAEWAIADGGRPRRPAALDHLQRAIAVSQNRMHGRLYEAMTVLSRALAAEGQFLAARALTLMQITLHRDDPRAAGVHGAVERLARGAAGGQRRSPVGRGPGRCGLETGLRQGSGSCQLGTTG